MKKIVHILLAFCLAGAAMAAANDAKTLALWPDGSLVPTPKQGGKAFQVQTTKEQIVLKFSDIKSSDDYVFLDFGRAKLADLGEGGYVEVEAETDNPIARITVALADPDKFWETNQYLEGNALMRAGRQTYRFYFSGLRPSRLVSGNDRLYVFIQDLGGEARGNATIKISKVVLGETVGGWLDEMKSTYARQYRWPEVEKIEPLYYEHLEKGVDWKQVSSDPSLTRLSLDGPWRKKFFGEKTWDYPFLADDQYAQPGYLDENWETVQVTEPSVPDQKGGYFWYRCVFDLPEDFPRKRVYLRLDDLADDARIYLNGKLVGTQTSTEKRLDWVAENGSRKAFMFGVPVKKAVMWQHFDRCGVPFPFDEAAVPDGKNRLVLPIYSDDFEWPLAYDVTDYLQPGKNTLAIRLYGNPMRAWWIFRHRDDRAAKNIYGILAPVTLAGVARPQIESLVRIPPETVDGDAFALHRFQCVLRSGDESAIKEILFRCDGREIRVPFEPGKAVSAEFRLPADFRNYVTEVFVIGQKGEVLDQRKLSFYGVVVEVKDRKLKVNGDPFFARGINSNSGVEFENDRTLTRKEFLRLLRQYQQLGVNALRIEGASWQLEEAFKHGMMVIPVTAAASTDLSIGVFGQLVEPDLRLACARQRLLGLLLNDSPNILMWNGSNEIHHTPGYADRKVMEDYLEGIRQAFRESDPYKRFVTHANLDQWRQNWFFTEGQDIVGWNTYQSAEGIAAQLPEMEKEVGDRAIVVTEWGTLKGKPDREGKEDAWEKEMRDKWEVLSRAPGVVGMFLFPFHGELEDERGRAFVRSLLLPFTLKKLEDVVVFTNRSEAPMRKVNFQIVRGPDVSNVKWVDEIAPGASEKIPLPLQSGGVLEVRYDTHHGLNHYYSEVLE